MAVKRVFGKLVGLLILDFRLLQLWRELDCVCCMHAEAVYMRLPARSADVVLLDTTRQERA